MKEVGEKYLIKVDCESKLMSLGWKWISEISGRYSGPVEGWHCDIASCGAIVCPKTVIEEREWINKDSKGGS